MKRMIAILGSGLLFSSLSMAAPTADEMVATMTDKSVAWEVRCEAEDSLADLPPREVLSLLLPHIGKGMPSPLIWNSFGREHDKRAPTEWQVFYAVTRSWDRQVDALPRDGGGRILVDLLGSAKSADGRIRLLMALTHRWAPDAEVPLAVLLKAPDEDSTVRTTAASALMLHGKENYHSFFLEYALAGTFEDRKRWFELLSDPRHKHRRGMDPQVVQIGFSLVAEERQMRPDFVHGAYFLAVGLGSYVGQEFKPDSRDPRYQDEHGLAESFFADTVTNALDWWGKNRNEIEEGSLSR